MVLLKRLLIATIVVLIPLLVFSFLAREDSAAFSRIRDLFTGPQEAKEWRTVTRQRRGFGMTYRPRRGYVAVITKIDEGSPAAEAGIEEGSRIIAVNGRRFGNVRRFIAYMRTQNLVVLLIDRDGETERHALVRAVYEYQERVMGSTDESEPSVAPEKVPVPEATNPS